MTHQEGKLIEDLFRYSNNGIAFIEERVFGGKTYLHVVFPHLCSINDIKPHISETTKFLGYEPSCRWASHEFLIEE